MEKGSVVGSAVKKDAPVESGETDWDAYNPVRVDKEDQLSDKKAKERWSALYSLIRLPSASEEIKKQVRCAVYAYCCVNGTSRVGNYKGDIAITSGTEFASAMLVEAVGSMDLRRFLRAGMEESYNYLKHSQYLKEKEPKFIARAAALGIGPDEAFAMADWLTDCPKFTPMERHAHDVSRVRGLTKAKYARNGDTLEQIAGEANEAAIKAGSSAPEISGSGVF